MTLITGDKHNKTKYIKINKYTDLSKICIS